MSGKLKFYYGTVNSSKTMQLLSIAHNYESCNWTVCTIKPELDSRSKLIETRAKVPPRKPDIVIKYDESLNNYSDIVNNANVILVDECQFLSVEQINELRNLSVNRNIDILCFGLRTDSNAHLFDASKRLFELADELIEIKTICSVCGKSANFNKKVNKNSEQYHMHNGAVVNISWNAFEQRCYKHFMEE